MSAQALSFEEVEALLEAIYDQAWDFEMDLGNLFDDEPPAEEPRAEEDPESEDPGWRQWDFL